ncbi:hypothetical protein BOTCAL_0140g00240 [Botryotinia calthae]|uniref:Uncharacterized protein n=1 Tax=Botryotinia calthae TaxID=38488 RepID=A0A4Y8D3P3_9HELO|nr:hypothetical protein BOTCAL_0140g00240 [Botryotinia calthae]
MVFEKAVPDRNSQVADFFFEVCRDPSQFLVSIYDEISPASHLLPLLNACKLSRKVVYDQLKNITLSTPEPHGTMGKTNDERIPIRYFWVNDRRLIQTYIDPVRDTLMLNIPDLLLLRKLGRSIDLSNVERIALTSFPTDFNRSARHVLDEFSNLLLFLSTRCHDLKILQIVSMFPVHTFPRLYRLEKMRGYHVIDTEPEMWHDDYWDGDGCMRYHINSVESVLEDAKAKETYYLRCLKEMKNRDNFEYWKELKLTTALFCRLDTDSNWETLGKKAPEPRLYCFSFQAWILAHEDGSPLNKYKGLAQIFEGAPW